MVQGFEQSDEHGGHREKCGDAFTFDQPGQRSCVEQFDHQHFAACLQGTQGGGGAARRVKHGHEICPD